MKIFSNIRYYLLLVILLSSCNLFAQNKKDYKNDDFCSDNWNWSNSDRVSAKELRETTFAAPESLNVDAGRNGGISIRGENRSDVLVRACIQTWGKTKEEANAIPGNIRIETGSSVRADASTGNDNWGVSFQILVPRSMNLDLKAYNGGISLSSVEGDLKFETINGGVNLSNLSGNVKGRTSNGGVSVALSGASWRGSGLDVETKNGGVRITMPENYAANVETGTINGGFKSNIAALNPGDDNGNKWNRKKRINTSINGGGAQIRIITTNGGIRIDSME